MLKILNKFHPKSQAGYNTYLIPLKLRKENQINHYKGNALLKGIGIRPHPPPGRQTPNRPVQGTAGRTKPKKNQSLI